MKNIHFFLFTCILTTSLCLSGCASNRYTKQDEENALKSWHSCVYSTAKKADDGQVSSKALADFCEAECINEWNRMVHVFSDGLTPKYKRQFYLDLKTTRSDEVLNMVVMTRKHKQEGR